MAASVGILTRTGGITSHAAVVARGMDKTCVVGAEDLDLSELAGKNVTIDGATGRIWVDKDVPIVSGQIPAFVEDMVEWALEGNTSFLTVAPESVSKGAKAYVDLSGCLKNQTTLSGALKTLRASGGAGVIGFGRNESIPKVDSDFLGYFGITTQEYVDDVSKTIHKVLCMKMWTKTFKKNWTLHMPAGTSLKEIEIMRKHGWGVVTVVDNFKAALSVDGYVLIEEAFADQLERENMTFSDIEKVIIEAGREVKELPQRVTRNRALFDVLGG